MALFFEPPCVQTKTNKLNGILLKQKYFVIIWRLKLEFWEFWRKQYMAEVPKSFPCVYLKKFGECVAEVTKFYDVAVKPIICSGEYVSNVADAEVPNSFPCVKPKMSSGRFVAEAPSSTTIMRSSSSTCLLPIPDKVALQRMQPAKEPPIKLNRRHVTHAWTRCRNVPKRQPWDVLRRKWGRSHNIGGKVAKMWPCIASFLPAKTLENTWNVRRPSFLMQCEWKSLTSFDAVRVYFEPPFHH